MSCCSWDSEHPLPPDDITLLLKNWSEGDQDSFARLAPLIYQELKKLAGCYFRGESRGHTLQTTALVNEAWLELVRADSVSFENRRQFFAYAGHIMRHILVRHALERRAQKRGGDRDRVSIDDSFQLSDGKPLDMDKILTLDASLNRLAHLDERQCRIVELRFFVGMNHSEIANVLSLSPTTVKREWRSARLWLSHELGQLERARDAGEGSLSVLLT